jgi:hypothetical protein
MNSLYFLYGSELEADTIEIAFATAAIFDHGDTLVSGDLAAANEDACDDYDNLYLVPN